MPTSRPGCGLPAETPTQNGKAYELLVAVFKEAVAVGLIDVSPCTLRGAGAPERTRDPETLTPAEVDAYLAAVPAKWRPALLLSVTCALRIGEVLALRAKDLDLTHGTLTVRATVAKVSDGQGHRKRVLQAPKTAAGVRTVHLLPRTVPELQKWREGLGELSDDALLFPDSYGRPVNDDVLRRAHKKGAVAAQIITAWLVDWDKRHPDATPDDLLFTALDGKSPMSESTLRDAHIVGRDAISKPTLTIHDLRRTGATLAGQSGATFKELMHRLGHTLPQIAMIYQVADAQRVAAVASRMSALTEGS